MNIHRSRFVDFTPHTITHLAFSHRSTKGSTPSDLRLAVGRNNGDIEIWNPRHNWFHEQTLRGGKGRTIEGLAWALYDSIPRLFSIGGSSVITEWNLKTGMPLKNYDCNAGIIWCLKVDSASEKIAVGCDNGSVVLIDISGGPGSLEHDVVLQRQNSRVLSIDFNTNLQVIGGCADGKIRVWDIASESKTRGRLVGTMKVDKSTKRESTLVWSVLVLENRNQIVSGDSTGSLKIWDLKYYTLQQSFDSHKADILSITTDVDQEQIFSSGVDRKIFNYTLITNTSNAATTTATIPAKDILKKQWISSSSKLLHANDIRSITSFESKGLSLLVSGGVERQLVINSVKFFNSSIYRKLPISVQYQRNVLQNSSQRFVVMWQDQTVKIWKIFKNAFANESSSRPDLGNKKHYKLVLRLVLSEEENISDVAISNNGDCLAVAYLSSVKMFRLTYNEKTEKLKVSKLKLLSSKLQNVGARFLQFTNDGANLIVVDPDNDIMKINTVEYSDSEEDDNNEKKDLQLTMFDLPEIEGLKSKLGHAGNIRDFRVSADDKVIAVSRYYGALDLIFLDTKSETGFNVVELARLSSGVSAIEFTGKNTLVAITVENKIYEFNINQNDVITSTDAPESKMLLTAWSKKNSEYLPKEFLALKNKCIGIFTDKKDIARIWLWGADWLCFLNLDINLSLSKKKSSLKRTNDGLTIHHDVEVDDDENNTENEEPVIESLFNADGSIIKYNGSQDDEFSKFENNQLVFKGNFKNHANGEGDGAVKNNEPKPVPFWITNKYKSILSVGSFDKNDMVVVERPLSHLPATPAFKTNNITF